MSGNIQAIVMPKWGLAMQEGMLTEWYVDEGAEIKPGMEVCDIETSKIASALEATISGTLQRRITEPGATLPVGALMAVVVDGEASDADIDAFIAKFEEEFAVAAAAAEAEGPKNRSVPVGDHTINYLPMGEGDVPIIFIHGFGGDLNNWMFNQPALAEQRATYALELPGHGASSKVVDDGSVAGMAAVVSGFMDALAIDQAHLVGHSMGGAIAMQVALEQPERVASLTLVSSAGLGPDINIDYINGFVDAASRKQIKPHLQTLFADASLVTRDLINDILKYKRLDGVDAALKAIAGATFPGGAQGTVLKQRMADLKAPVQVIFGDQDQIIPAAHGQDLAGNVSVHVLEKAGHMPHMEAAGEVNRLIGEIVG